MKSLRERIYDLEKIAVDDLGLDFYSINFEVVSEEVMLEIMSYGLPTRGRHWSYGKNYEYQKINGEMGHSKVYELVLNNDPSYAFLLDTNPLVANTMVSAHVIGHVHFFKNNYLFKKTDRKMVYRAAERAARIDSYIDAYGIDKVEACMNMALSMEKQIDWSKGEERLPYPGRRLIRNTGVNDQFSDLLNSDSDVKEFLINSEFPPYPERDLLWFFANFSNMEPWKKDIFEITRKESFYFYPQYMTKIMNEGFASYVHCELMYLYTDVSPMEHINFSKIHERVVQAGNNNFYLNPYYLGFKIFNRIKEIWDKKYEDGESDIDGWAKILEVVKEDDDISFIRNYLDIELCKDLKMFNYKQGSTKDIDYIEITSTDLDEVKESIIKDLYNYRAPDLRIEKASDSGLELRNYDGIELDVKHIEKVMAYIYEIWGGMVNIECLDDKKEVINYTFDEFGFSHANSLSIFDIDI